MMHNVLELILRMPRRDGRFGVARVSRRAGGAALCLAVLLLSCRYAAAAPERADRVRFVGEAPRHGATATAQEPRSASTQHVPEPPPPTQSVPPQRDERSLPRDTVERESSAESYRRFSLAVTGDLLIHESVRRRARRGGGRFDFGPQLAAVRNDIAAADLGLCHLEVPLDPDGPYSSYPSFNAPAELADAIAATGWDVCSTASNHSADQGREGVTNTLDALEQSGVSHRGMYRSAVEAQKPRLYRIEGVAVGLLSATYGLNDHAPPGGAWAVPRLDLALLRKRARLLRAAGADVVVASLHWGTQYDHAPTDRQRQIALWLLAPGHVDAIIGHHAHVMQPIERIAGRPVVYGVGNFLSGQEAAERRDGVILTLEFVETDSGWWVGALHAQPTWVTEDYRVVPVYPGDGGVLGASARRTLGYLGVPLSPPPRLR